MLKLSDRIEVAFNNGLGIQLSPAEVKAMAEIMIYLHQGKVGRLTLKLKELLA